MMKIKREINGTEYEFELTPYEMFDAYNEKHIDYLREDVESRLAEDTDDDAREYSEQDIDSIVGIAEKVIDRNDYYAEVYLDCIQYAIDCYEKEGE